MIFLKDYLLTKKLKTYLLLLIVSILSSCASIKSGHYIALAKGETLATVAKKLNIKESVLKRHNQTTQAGWIFVPSTVGLIPRMNKLYFFNDFEPGQFVWPVPGSKRISSKYGYRRGKPHDGIDIAASSGTHIISSADGEVVYSTNKIRGYGNMIVIKHMDDYFTVYAHNRKNFVSKGQKVHQGQVIGQVGNTGRSTGPHLHFEVRKKDRKLNPITFVGHELNNIAGN